MTLSGYDKCGSTVVSDIGLLSCEDEKGHHHYLTESNRWHYNYKYHYTWRGKDPQTLHRFNKGEGDT